MTLVLAAFVGVSAKYQRFPLHRRSVSHARTVKKPREIFSLASEKKVRAKIMKGTKVQTLSVVHTLAFL